METVWIQGSGYFPAVQQLAIHEEDQQSIVFREGEAMNALESVKDTTLMAFFKFNCTEVQPGNLNIKIFQSLAPFLKTLGTGESFHQNLRKKSLANLRICFITY